MLCGLACLDGLGAIKDRDKRRGGNAQYDFAECQVGQ